MLQRYCTNSNGKRRRANISIQKTQYIFWLKSILIFQFATMDNNAEMYQTIIFLIFKGSNFIFKLNWLNSVFFFNWKNSTITEKLVNQTIEFVLQVKRLVPVVRIFKNSVFFKLKKKFDHFDIKNYNSLILSSVIIIYDN